MRSCITLNYLKGQIMVKGKHGNTRDNVFYDNFDEMMEHYSEFITEIWHETRTVCMANTDATTGLFDKSDIICVYDDRGDPTIITERIFRDNYSWREWIHVKKILRLKTRYLGQELGFNIKVTIGHGYIDFIHYKEEWWDWARRSQQRGWY